MKQMFFAALVSSSTSNEDSPRTTLTQQPVSDSSPSLPSHESSVSASSSLSAIASSSAYRIISSSSPGYELRLSSLTRSPFMSSFLSVSYITTHSGVNGTQDFLPTREMATSLIQSPLVSNVSYKSNPMKNTPTLTSSYRGTDEKPALTVTSLKSDTLQSTNSFKIAPSTAVKVTASTTNHKEESGDVIYNLLKGNYLTIKRV